MGYWLAFMARCRMLILVDNYYFDLKAAWQAMLLCKHNMMICVDCAAGRAYGSYSGACYDDVDSGPRNGISALLCVGSSHHCCRSAAVPVDTLGSNCRCFLDCGLDCVPAAFHHIAVSLCCQAYMPYRWYSCVLSCSPVVQSSLCHSRMKPSTCSKHTISLLRQCSLFMFRAICVVLECRL